jgi:hypothetical protein
MIHLRDDVQTELIRLQTRAEIMLAMLNAAEVVATDPPPWLKPETAKELTELRTTILTNLIAYKQTIRRARSE